MSFLSNIINAVKTIITGVKTRKVTDLIVDLVAYIPGIIRDITKVMDMKKDGFDKEEYKQLINDALLEFDSLTGSEEGAQHLIKNMPPQVEEETLDAFKTILRNLLYQKIGIDGYTTNTEEE